jgi:hypothetical protein
MLVENDDSMISKWKLPGRDAMNRMAVAREVGRLNSTAVCRFAADIERGSRAPFNLEASLF